MRLPLPIAIGLLCMIGGPTPAFAAARVWTGAGPNNLWSTPQNWQGNVAPVSGDGVTFPDLAPQNNNVNDLPNGTLFSAIAFHGTYVISGNRVLIDNNIRVAGANGTTVAFQCDITTGGNGATVLFVDVLDGNLLLTTGVISGATAISKISPGAWNISGAAPNTYTGDTRVLAGTIVLNKPVGVAAVPAGLNIGDNIGGAAADVVRLASDKQIEGPVIIRSSGLLELNGRVESLAGLVLAEGQITTGAGELTLTSDVEVGGEGSTISGRLALGGAPRVFNTTSTSQTLPALTISAVISAVGGDGGLIKRGPGMMVLEGANAYAGFTRVEAGMLVASHPQALGVAAPDAGTGVLAGGRVAVTDTVGFEPLLLEKGSTTQHALQCIGFGAKTWLGPIHITGSNGVSSPVSCTLRLGPISGSGELWISGNVTEFNAAGSDYVGDTRVESGTLRINGPNRIPDTTTIRLPTNGTLSLNGFNDVVGSIDGAQTSSIQLGAGTLTVSTPANTVATYAGGISGSGSVLHNGPGRWILTGSHQYLGQTIVGSGTLQLDGATAAASDVVIGGTGVLTGTGIAAGAIVGVAGQFRPGRDDGTGIIKTGSLGLSANHTVDFRIRRGSATRIEAKGTVNPFLATLALQKIGSEQIDTPLLLIDNDGVEPVGSTFAGLPEGSFITAGGQQFRITYEGGSGNDVVISPTELTYFLSEGSTGDFFDTEILIANPHNTTIPVAVEFLVEGGGQVITQDYLLPRMSRTTIVVDDIPGLQNAAVSTKVRSTLAAPIVVERTMWWGGSTRYGAHTEKASGGAAPRWFFAEGSQGFFFTFLLLANPHAQAQDAAVRFLLEGGGEVVRTVPLPPFSRQTVYAGDVPEVVGQSFGMDVTFTQTGIAERAMYFGTEPLWMAGHESAGVTEPSTTWFLAEGATGPFFDTFILLANPNAAAADVTVRFLPDNGMPVIKQVSVAANGRATMNIEPQDGSLANAAVATDISSTIPIVAERAQYWPDPAPAWYEAHNSFGVAETAVKWGLAEGQVGGPAGYQTYVLLANPTANPASVSITFLRETGDPIVKQFTVNPTSRLNVSVRDGGDVPELTNERFGAVIESSMPIAVERALYANVGPQVWGAGTNATATRLPFP